MARMRALGQHEEPAQEPAKSESKPHASPSAKHAKTESLSWKVWLEKLYEQDYRKLTYLTLIILALSIAQIGYQIATTGDFITKGVSLKGGITVTIGETKVTATELDAMLREGFPAADISVREITASGKHGLSVEADITDDNEINRFKTTIEEKLAVTPELYSIEQIGSSLGDSFFKQVILSLVIAFVLMAVMVIIWFRNLGPSMIVILAAFCDIVETIAAINILGIKVSTGGIAALLMLVGYSVDTDILLSTRVLKRKEGSVYDATVDAFKTGMMMTGTALVAVIIGYFVSVSEALKQIMLILIIGLGFDILNTWIQNAALLRWYLEYREKKKTAKGSAP